MDSYKFFTRILMSLYSCCWGYLYVYMYIFAYQWLLSKTSRRVSLFNGMERWNGTVEWNGMEWNGHAYVIIDPTPA